ncbi:MAG: uracil-DNA glycosylase [Planctomycetaceae bacterium]|nr:uracil-DNA glycosylase [Planctomycetaceae bacterium]
MWELRDLPSAATDWGRVLTDFFQSTTGSELLSRLRMESQSHQIFPPAAAVFRALELTPREDVRVVILGQDPYHGAGQADGLAFSVPSGVTRPPSLRNIFRELQDDLGVSIPPSFELSRWARQGVLLLNTTLTVRQDAAGSHRGFGWEMLTDLVIQLVNDLPVPVVFIMWGKDAEKKLTRVDRQRHLAICSPHPSPLSAHRGFFGSRPFSRANQFLAGHGRDTIDWI